MMRDLRIDCLPSIKFCTISVNLDIREDPYVLMENQINANPEADINFDDDAEVAAELEEIHSLQTEADIITTPEPYATDVTDPPPAPYATDVTDPPPASAAVGIQDTANIAAIASSSRDTAPLRLKRSRYLAGYSDRIAACACGCGAVDDERAMRKCTMCLARVFHSCYSTYICACRVNTLEAERLENNNVVS